MQNVIEDHWLNLLWISALDRPKTIGEISNAWAYANQNIFSRHQEKIDAAVKTGLFSVMDGLPKKKGTIKLYRSEFKNYFKLFEKDVRHAHLVKDYFIKDSKLWIKIWNDKFIRSSLFNLAEIHTLLRDNSLAGKDGFRTPLTLSALYANSIAYMLFRKKYNLVIDDYNKLPGGFGFDFMGFYYSLEVKYHLEGFAGGSPYRHIFEGNGQGYKIAKELQNLGIEETKLFKDALEFFENRRKNKPSFL